MSFKDIIRKNQSTGSSIERFLYSGDPYKEAFSIAVDKFNPDGVDNMAARIKKYGLASPNKYKVMIFPPRLPKVGAPNLGFGTSFFPGTGFGGNPGTLGTFDMGMKARFLPMSCIAASIPGTAFQTLERKIKGPHEKIPYGKSFEDVTLTFLVSQNLQEKLFFEAWQNIIMNENDEFNFYDEYVSSIRIAQLNKQLDTIYEVELLEAYPITISSLVLDAGSTDEVHKLDVTFTYHKWIQIPHVVTSNTSTADIISGVLGANYSGAGYNNYKKFF